MSFVGNLFLVLGIVTATTANANETKIVADVTVAAEWIAKALSSSGYKADFSVESLKEIDRFFDDQMLNGAPKPNGLLATQRGSRLFALGAYVGEVIRRSAGGEWIGDDNDPQAEINVALRLKHGTILWPIQRVIKRFNNGSEDGIYAYGIGTLRCEGSPKC